MNAPTTATEPTTTAPTGIAPSWLLSTDEQSNSPSDRPRQPSGKPVPAGVEYHRVLAGDKRRIGRGILAIVLLLAGLVVFPTVISTAVAQIDLRLGNVSPILGGTDYTPLYQASSMISLALLIPWSMLIQRWLYGVPGASLHSVTSRFRFALFAKTLLVIGPVWLLATMLPGINLPPGAEFPWSHTDVVLMILVTILFTPLQAAGEEYGFRGLMFRVVASWSRGPRAGLVAGILASSAVFTFIHGTTDPYFLVWYTVLGASMAIITWRTGGLEIVAMLHAVLNTATFVFAAAVRSDIGGQLQDRSAAVNSELQLIPTLAFVVITAIVWWATRKTGPALTPGTSAASTDQD